MDTETKGKGRPFGSTDSTKRTKIAPRTLRLVDEVTTILEDRAVPQKVKRRQAARRASLLAQEKGLADATLEEQLIATSEVFAEQVFETAFVLANTRCSDIETDSLAAAIFDVRVKYVKEMLGFSQKCRALAKQVREDNKEEASIVNTWKSEADGLLAEANAMLAEVRE